MSSYDNWLTSEPIIERFCPSCLQPVTEYEYDPDAQVTLASCECGWDGTEGELLHEWEVARDYAEDRADVVNELRACGLI